MLARRSVNPRMRAQVSQCMPRTPVVLTLAARGGAVAEKPKRAASAYNLFVKDKYNAVKQQLTQRGQPAGLGDVSKLLRQEWTSLGPQGKAPYEEKSQKEKEAVAAARKPRNDGPPKPIAPYAAFTKEQFKQVKAKNPNFTTPQVTKVIAGMWNQMDKAKKEAMSQQYKNEMEKYKQLVAASAKPQQAAAVQSTAQAPKAPAPAPAAASAAQSGPRRPQSRAPSTVRH